VLLQPSAGFRELLAEQAKAAVDNDALVALGSVVVLTPVYFLPPSTASD